MKSSIYRGLFFSVVSICATWSTSQAAEADKIAVEITSNPSHAAIYVDDKRRGIIGYTPTELPLLPGTHKIFFELEGYIPTHAFLNVSPEQHAVSATLEEDKTPSQKRVKYTHLRALFGFGGHAERESDVFDGVQKFDVPDDGPRFGLAIQGFTAYAPYFAFGVQLPLFFVGLNGDVSLDISPQLRFRYPFQRNGRDFVSVYVQLGGGLTLYFPEDFYLRETKCYTPSFIFGWNIGAVGGAQLNFTQFLGAFVDAGWQIHKVYGTFESPDAKFTIMRHEVLLTFGLAFILSN